MASKSCAPHSKPYPTIRPQLFLAVRPFQARPADLRVEAQHATPPAHCCAFPIARIFMQQLPRHGSRATDEPEDDLSYLFRPTSGEHQSWRRRLCRLRHQSPCEWTGPDFCRFLTMRRGYKAFGRQVPRMNLSSTYRAPIRVVCPRRVQRLRFSGAATDKGWAPSFDGATFCASPSSKSRKWNDRK